MTTYLLQSPGPGGVRVVDVDGQQQTLTATPDTSGGATPLADTSWIDGLTTGSTPDGSTDNPFPTIAAFLASIPAPATSTDDADTMRTGLVSSSPAGTISGALTIPAYRSVNLRSFATASNDEGQGNTLTSAITWANTAAAAGAGAIAPEVAQVGLGEFGLLAGSSLVMTDDGTVAAILSLIGVIGPQGDFGQGFQGDITATGATELAQVYINGFQYEGTMDVPSAEVLMQTSLLVGPLTCEFLTAANCTLVEDLTVTGTGEAGEFRGTSFVDVGTLTMATGRPFFYGCDWITAMALDCGSASPPVFDGPSWQSFLGAGSTLTGTAPGPLVLGGYQRGVVEGAALAQNADATYVVSLDGTNATGAGSPWAKGGNHYTAPAAVVLTADQTVAPTTGGGEEVGDTMGFTITNPTASALFVWTVLDTAGNLQLQVPAGSQGYVVFQYLTATGWTFLEGSVYVSPVI